MEVWCEDFSTVPTALDPHPNDPSIIALGQIDGLIKFCSIEPEEQHIQSSSSYKLKRCVRKLLWNKDGSSVYSLSENRALCVIDANTAQRTRCIIEAHDDKPCSITHAPLIVKGEQIVTGDESGAVKTWDMRAKDPSIHKFNDLEGMVNALRSEGNTLLAASSDGTLAAYDVRKGKLKVQSEMMHSELASITSNSKYVYVGGGDGMIEVFNTGEYGNIAERIETELLSVDNMVQLRKGLILAASSQEEGLRLLHVDPNHRLPKPGAHDGGVDLMALTCDNKYIITMSLIGQSIKMWDSEKICAKVPFMTSTSVSAESKKLTAKADKGGFFDDLMENEDGEEDDSDEEDSGDEEEADGAGDMKNGEDDELADHHLRVEEYERIKVWNEQVCIVRGLHRIPVNTLYDILPADAISKSGSLILFFFDQVESCTAARIALEKEVMEMDTPLRIEEPIMRFPDIRPISRRTLIVLYFPPDVLLITVTKLFPDAYMNLEVVNGVTILVVTFDNEHAAYTAFRDSDFLQLEGQPVLVLFGRRDINTQVQAVTDFREALRRLFASIKVSM